MPSPSDEPPPSNYPVAMGPGARPTQAGDSPARTRLHEIMLARSKYHISADQNALQISYELNGAPRTYNLPFEALPLGSWSRFWLYGGENRSRSSGILLIDTIRDAEKATRRPVSQSEAEGLAYWASKRLAWGLQANIGAVLGGAIIGWRTYNTMRFPFVKPKPIENYNHFPSSRLPLFAGASSRALWHFVRGNVWALLTLMVTKPVASILANSMTTWGIMSDERLQTLTAELRPIATFQENDRRQSQQQRQQQRKETGSYSNSDSDAQSYYKDVERRSPTHYSGDRDNSYSGDNAYSDGTTDTETLTDSAVKSRDQARERSSESGGGSLYGTRPQPTQSNPSHTDSEPFFYDDASPTAGNDPDMGTPSSYDRSTGGSAWERIRRGNAAAPSSERRQQALPDPRSRDPYSQSRSRTQDPQNPETDSFGAKDKDAAQREFDDMLERERRQGGSDEYDSGMRAIESGQERNASQGMSAWERRRRGG